MRRMGYALCFTAILALVIPAANVEAKERVITHKELTDKVSGYWIGQLLGNYMGFPFENNWVDEPVDLVLRDRKIQSDKVLTGNS